MGHTVNVSRSGVCSQLVREWKTQKKKPIIVVVCICKMSLDETNWDFGQSHVWENEKTKLSLWPPSTPTITSAYHWHLIMNYTHFMSLIDSKSWNLCSLYVSTICHDKSQVNPLLIFFFLAVKTGVIVLNDTIDHLWISRGSSSPIHFTGEEDSPWREDEEQKNSSIWMTEYQHREAVSESRAAQCKHTHTHTKRHGNWKRHKQKRWPRSRLHLHGGRSSSTTLIFEAKQWDDFENMNFCPKIMNNKTHN